MESVPVEAPAAMEPVRWPAAFDAPGWLWQVKWDGVRCLAAAGGRAVQLWSRRGSDWTGRFPEVAADVAAVAARAGGPVVLDGEVVAIDPSGGPSFPLLMRRAGRAAPAPALVRAVPVVYAVFDVLAWGGDLRREPLEARLDRLSRIPARPHLRAVAGTEGGGVGFVDRAAAAGLEGAVAKRLGSPYVAGPSGDWRKVKVRRSLAALVVGYVADPDGRLRSLCLAVPAGGGLAYAGDVGSGLPARAWAEVAARMAAAPPWTPPFAAPAPRGPGRRFWRRPELAATVTYAEWTPEGRLRAPALLRLDPLPSSRRAPSGAPPGAGDAEPGG